MPPKADLVVIGGGPAGSTLAGLVKKYNPKRRVVLLEKAPGPRHHVGESLLPGLIPVLKELGVLGKIEAAGFPKKVGANYQWGKDGKVWENDFNEVNLDDMIRRYGSIPERIEYAWQVRRSIYDEILLKHAEDLGVELWRGTSAKGIIEKGDVINGIRFEKNGKNGSLKCGLLADCSGQTGFLSKFRNIRSYHQGLRNLALYAYFKGARWKYEYSGHPDKTKIFVCSTRTGWFWYIPISKDIVSVGLVSTVEQVRKEGAKDLEALFMGELKACAEIWPLLQGAERVKDMDGSGKDFFTQSDWSYLSERSAGPGWLAAGDAAMFVDPILSTGVTLAHLGAQRAAYTLSTAWREKDARLKAMLWEDYNTFCRESAAQYFVMALFWYGNDRFAPRWWEKAREVQRAVLPVALSDKGAFVAVSAALTQYYDRACSTAHLAQDEPARPHEFPFYKNVLGGGAEAKTWREGEPLGLAFRFKVEYAFLPDGPGRLRPVKRVRFLKDDTTDPVRDAVNPRRFVTPRHLALLELLDGTRDWAALRSELARRGLPAEWLDRGARVFLEELAVQGVLAQGSPARAP